MFDFLKIFDAYSLRARLFPAIIAVAPALAALALLISWRSFELSNAIVSIAMLVLVFAMADFARMRGRALEQHLYAAQGGKPSIVFFRRNDPTLEDSLKERYRVFLAGKLGLAVPTPELEKADQRAADSFYEQCGVWLRAHTRDTKKFNLLFAENVTYGFRRNLFGVKWTALGLNVLVVAVCFAFVWHDHWTWEAGFEKRAVVVLLIATIHAVYICVAVRESFVADASRAYAREMILSCEAFLAAPTTTSPRKAPAARKRAKRDEAP